MDFAPALAIHFGCVHVLNKYYGCPLPAGVTSVQLAKICLEILVGSDLKPASTPVDTGA
jgi:hypothetical protein